MGLSIAEFDVSITPSFSKAGKTASSSAAIRNVVKMAIASKNSEIKRQQKDLGRGRSFQAMTCYAELASQYRSVSEENPKIEKFFEDTGRGEEMCSSPRASAHWRLKHDWEVDSAPTVFQRVVKWEEPDATVLVRRPTGMEPDVRIEEKLSDKTSQTVRPSPCFTAVPRGKRAAELFSDKESIPPVGFYHPRSAFVLPKTDVSIKFTYPKACEPRTPLTREQIHEQYPLSRPSSAAASYNSRAATPSNTSHTAGSAADHSLLDATKPSDFAVSNERVHDAAESSAGKAKAAKSRSRSPSPSGSWFFNKSDRIICAEPMYRTAITPKEEYDVDKGWALLQRNSPGVSLNVVGRDDRATETFDRIYPGAWVVTRKVGVLPMAKTTGRDRPASGSRIPGQFINSVELVESLPFTSERARPASVDLKRSTGRNAPVITKMAAATSHAVDAMYNPQLNVVRQRLATPVPFSKLLGRSPPPKFSMAVDDDEPPMYDSGKALEFVEPRSKSPGSNPRYDWTEAFYKTVERGRSPVNMQLQRARPSAAHAPRADAHAAESTGRTAATLTRSQRPATALR